jgi:hypothetical protein
MLSLFFELFRLFLAVDVSLQWRNFMLETWRSAKPGTVFLFFEPTVWQHHELLSALGIKAMLRGAKCADNVGSAPNQGGTVDSEAAPRYWWLDGVDRDDDAAKHSEKMHSALPKSVSENDFLIEIDYDEVMRRQGPGILLLEKPNV